jgi:hypothetical protein
VNTPLRSAELTNVTEWEDGQMRSTSGDLAREKPLRIFGCGELATLRTEPAMRELESENRSEKKRRKAKL